MDCKNNIPTFKSSKIYDILLKIKFIIFFINPPFVLPDGLPQNPPKTFLYKKKKPNYRSNIIFTVVF